MKSPPMTSGPGPLYNRGPDRDVEVEHRSRGQREVRVQESLHVRPIENLDGDDVTADDIEYHQPGVSLKHQARVVISIGAFGRGGGVDVSAVPLPAGAASQHNQPRNLIYQLGTLRLANQVREFGRERREQ